MVETNGTIVALDLAGTGSRQKLKLLLAMLNTPVPQAAATCKLYHIYTAGIVKCFQDRSKSLKTSAAGIHERGNKPVKCVGEDHASNWSP